MENRFVLNDVITNISSMLDEEFYPEMYDFLTSLLSDEKGVEMKPYDIATGVLHCDTGKALPPFVFDFLVELYKIGVNEKDADSMNDLGALYYDGKGVRQDFEKAIYYYKMAAEAGSRQAEENLGYCYYYGRSVDVDYEKAFHYFLLGALDGHLISLYKIGDMYKNGYYVKKNEREAYHIYRRCVETMTDESSKYVAGPVYLRLGNAFADGAGVDMDLESALVCYQKAEVFLYDMVKDGDYMYRKSYEAAIAGQEKVRIKMKEAIRHHRPHNG